MQRLILCKPYPEKFIYRYLPSAFIKIAANRILVHKKSRMNSYLLEHYNVSIVDVIKYLKFIKIDRYKDMYILHFDIEDRKIREIFHIISYGNLDVKGLRIIDSTFEYIAGNIHTLYSMFVLEENIRNEQMSKKGRKN